MPGRNLREIFLAADIHEMLPHERIVYFALAAEAGRQHGETRLEAMARKDLGHAYQAEHRYDEALESLRESLRLYESRHDLQGQAEVLDELGTGCSGMSDFELAQRYFLSGLRLSVTVGPTELRDTTVNHLMTMLSYEQRNRRDRPASNYVELENAAVECGIDDLADTARRILGRVVPAEDEQASWWPYDTSTISMDRLNDHAIQYLAADQSLRAIRIFQRMISHYQKNADEAKVNALLYSVGDAYREINLKEDAVSYLSQALAGYQTSGHGSMEARVAHYLAFIYRELGDAQSALRYARLGADAARSAAAPEAENMAILAVTLFDTGDWQKARTELAACLSLLGSAPQSEWYLRGEASDLMDVLAATWGLEVKADRGELAVEVGRYLSEDCSSPGSCPDPVIDRTLCRLATLWSTPTAGEKRWGWKRHQKGSS